MIALADAQAAIAAVECEARARAARPLAIILLDAGAHAIAFVRMDGASLFRIDIARGKAAGALGMGADTRDLAERARDNPTFFASVCAAVGGALVLSAGGVLVPGADGRPRGAIGVSGDTPDTDEACARAGLAILTQGDDKWRS